MPKKLLFSDETGLNKWKQPDVQVSPGHIKHIVDFQLHYKWKSGAVLLHVWENRDTKKYSLYHMPVDDQEQSSHLQPWQIK